MVFDTKLLELLAVDVAVLTTFNKYEIQRLN